MGANRPALAGARASLRTAVLLDAGASPGANGWFACVVSSGRGSDSSMRFYLPGVPAGTYGIVIHDVSGRQGPYALTTILQQAATGWQ